MHKQQIDIIIPNFNKGNFIKECLNSVINQTYKNWIIYIIDDASNDNSIDVLQEFSKNSNINIIKLKKNKGPSFCRNLGIRLSKSNFITFLDSDDFWEKNKLEKQLTEMMNKKFEFTYTDYIPFLTKNNKYVYKSKTNIKSSFSFEEFIKNSSINSSTMMIKRDIVKTHRFKKVELLEDYLFKCELLKNNISAIKIEDTNAYYRILPSNRSSNKIRNLIYLWKINNKYNNLSFFENLNSILGIMINSYKKYGIK